MAVIINNIFNLIQEEIVQPKNPIINLLLKATGTGQGNKQQTPSSQQSSPGLLHQLVNKSKDAIEKAGG